MPGKADTEPGMDDMFMDIRFILLANAQELSVLSLVLLRSNTCKLTLVMNRPQGR